MVLGKRCNPHGTEPCVANPFFPCISVFSVVVSAENLLKKTKIFALVVMRTRRTTTTFIPKATSPALRVLRALRG
jgi:hypothetical protein